VSSFRALAHLFLSLIVGASCSTSISAKTLSKLVQLDEFALIFQLVGARFGRIQLLHRTNRPLIGRVGPLLRAISAEPRKKPEHLSGKN